MRLWAYALLVLLCLTGTARADGKFFVEDPVPVGVPYQRAYLIFDGTTETLLLQSRYERSTTEGGGPLGWVVPCPAVPSFAAVPAPVAAELFGSLAARTQPRRVHLGIIVVSVTVLFGLGVFFLTLLAHLTPLFRNERQRLRWMSVVFLLLFLVFLFVGPGHWLGARRVQVLHAESIGIYDVEVVRSSDAGALMAWLDARGFRHDDEDRHVFRSYVESGWCFAVAVIDPERAQAEGGVDWRGLASPLVLRFASAEAVYPLSLTATTGSDTELDLYVLAPYRVDAGDRLSVRYAAPVAPDRLPLPTEEVEPAGFFTHHRPSPAWLTKVEGRLTPAAMAEDLVLEPAAAQETHRELDVRW